MWQKIQIRVSVSARIGPGPLTERLCLVLVMSAAVCAAALMFVDRYVPETKGRSFTEISAEVRDRWRGGRPDRARSAFRVHPRG